MIELINHGVYLLNGTEIRDEYQGVNPDEGRENTITYASFALTMLRVARERRCASASTR